MYSAQSRKLKLTTMISIVEALLERGEVEEANQASIILKMAIICDEFGIEKAMEYYNGVHSSAEYVEFTTGGNATRRTRKSHG